MYLAGRAAGWKARGDADVDALQDGPYLPSGHGEPVRTIRALDADEVTREELQMDQYKGDGVPPPALTLHLSPAELEAEKTRARTQLARRRAVVTAQAAALHAALRAATPQTLVPQ